MSKTNKCKECGSGQTYVRLETQDRVCRSCGAITPLKTKAKALPKALVEPSNAPPPEDA